MVKLAANLICAYESGKSRSIWTENLIHVARKGSEMQQRLAL